MDNLEAVLVRGGFGEGVEGSSVRSTWGSWENVRFAVTRPPDRSLESTIHIILWRWKQ